jgi:spermidine synthase
MGKISFWKKIISYFREIHIESAPSEINPHLYVSLSKGRFMLSTARAVYSHGDLYDNFVQTFKRVDWSKIPDKEVLLLGYGLGSIPAILEKMNLAFQYTAVEKDANVIYLASKYSLPYLDSPIHLYEADAKAYMDQQFQQYAIICMDIFLEDEIPSNFISKEFIKQLDSALKNNGVLFANTLRSKDEENKELTPIQKRLKKQFPQGRFIEVGPNAIFVSNSNVLK